MYLDFFIQSQEVGKTQTESLFLYIYRYMVCQVNPENQLLRKRKTEIHV